MKGEDKVQKDYFTIKDVARHCRRSCALVSIWVDQGRLATTPDGVVTREVLVDFLRRNRLPPLEEEMEPLLTAKEAAKFLHVSMFTLSRIEQAGYLVPFRTPGGHRRYDPKEVRRYLESTRCHPQNKREEEGEKEE